MYLICDLLVTRLLEILHNSFCSIKPAMGVVVVSLFADVLKLLNEDEMRVKASLNQAPVTARSISRSS